MCMALLQNTVRACGIGTRVRFCPLGEAENLLKTLLPCGRDPMKTQVGKSIHKLGVAVDHAVDSIVSEMR